MNNVFLMVSMVTLTTLVSSFAGATTLAAKGGFEDKFRQLDELLPTPNAYRSASGAPGHQYWQQEVDYQITATLNETQRRLTGQERITYKNHSPDTLDYLWLQLDQNRHRADSISSRTQSFGGPGTRGPATHAATDDQPARLSLDALRRLQFIADHELGYQLNQVTDKHGTPLHYVVVDTLLRIDLPKPLAPGDSVQFNIDYAFNIVEENAVSARSGYEHFPDDPRAGGNDIFQIAQWFPRLAAYTDYEAWTNKAFLGRGEFTLEFGDYDVKLTVPADHIVAATGTLQNPKQVLSTTQRQRLQQAENAERPVFVVTEQEALANEKDGTEQQKTWHFKAKNVRDFAWASSRKFMWDAKGYHQGGKDQPLVMAMSFYPKEGGELWQKYSTAAIIHTMKVYSRFSFDYPYPVAQSVNGPVGGMEYPMITFNGPRTELRKDGSRTYSLAEKRYLIGVVLHEIGHTYFPMVVNSDERQWTWMDEGLNSFLDGVAGREWDPTIPWGVEPRDVVEYMKSSPQVPVMTQSDSVLNIGRNAYAKPAVALNILRETILGRELFDFAFRQYAQRWKFKRPTPADFFRTMEEASGVDLDWFWRGWFYSTDHVDIAIDKIYRLRLDTNNPDIDFSRRRQEELDKPQSLTVVRNRNEGRQLWIEEFPDVQDYYDDHDRFTPTNKDRNQYHKFMAKLKDWERATLERAGKEDQNYYVLEFSNIGGLVMPIILELTFTDGTQEQRYIPAEIWRRSPDKVRKLIITDKTKLLQSVELDPHWETADTDVENNLYPRRIIPSRIEAYKAKKKSSLEYRDQMWDEKMPLKSEQDYKDKEDLL